MATEPQVVKSVRIPLPLWERYTRIFGDAEGKFSENFRTALKDYITTTEATLRAAEDPTPYGEHSKSPAAAPPPTVPNGKTNLRKSA